MQKITEEIWEMYKSGQNRAVSGEKRALTRKTISIQQKLLKTMTPEQVKLFFEYEECAGKKSIVCEKELFAAGVHFAVSFLAEALRGRGE